jgi:hypothetical protein
MKLDGDKTQDFKVLKDASDVLLEKLRNDEAVLDLKDQFNERMDAGNHKYYLDPYNKQWGYPMVRIP